MSFFHAISKRIVILETFLFEVDGSASPVRVSNIDREDDDIFFKSIELAQGEPRFSFLQD